MCKLGNLGTNWLSDNQTNRPVKALLINAIGKKCCHLFQTYRRCPIKTNFKRGKNLQPTGNLFMLVVSLKVKADAS